MRTLRILTVAFVVTALGGCVVGAPEIAEEVDIVQWDLRPMGVEESTEIHVGDGLIGFVAGIARLSDDRDAEFAASLLDGIEAVHLGAYEIDRFRDTPSDLSFAAREELTDLGWQLLVRTREHHDESAWVFARQTRSRTEMLVVSLEDDELVVVRVDGHPSHLMHAAIRRDRDFAMVAHGVHEEF